MSGYVGADHEFHDAEFVRGWANRFVPTESRIQLFDMILEEIAQPSVPNTHVVELGIPNRALELVVFQNVHFCPVNPQKFISDLRTYHGPTPPSRGEAHSPGGRCQ
jgi:hypothetical protein